MSEFHPSEFLEVGSLLLSQAQQLLLPQVCVYISLSAIYLQVPTPSVSAPPLRSLAPSHCPQDGPASPNSSGMQTPALFFLLTESQLPIHRAEDFIQEREGLLGFLPAPRTKPGTY